MGRLPGESRQWWGELETRLLGLGVPTQRRPSESPVERFKLPRPGLPPLEIPIQGVWCGAQEIHIWKKLFNHFVAFLFLMQGNLGQGSGSGHGKEELSLKRPCKIASKT